MKRFLIVGASGHDRSVAKEVLLKILNAAMAGGSILGYGVKVEADVVLAPGTALSVK